jgi:hypothetical protein
LSVYEVTAADPAPLRLAVGDAIAIALPGGGYGVAVIGRLTQERMLCTSFGPRFSNFPDADAASSWEPDGWSTWMVDTLGLRDGSWVKIAEPPAMAQTRHIDVRALPPFKFTSATTGKFHVALYDPDTLFVTKIVEPDEPEKYRAAPNYLPQDPTMFETALSRILESPCEFPDKDTVERLNAERLVVAMLRDRMSDLTKRLFSNTC